ncbi:MAG: TIGR00730 family Rossman fold protein, partial [Actinomycetes bacterium]
MAPTGNDHIERNIHEVRRGQVVLRRHAIQAPTADQQLLDSNDPDEGLSEDPWRVLRIEAELVEALGALARI